MNKFEAMTIQPAAPSRRECIQVSKLPAIWLLMATDATFNLQYTVYINRSLSQPIGKKQKRVKICTRTHSTAHTQQQARKKYCNEK
jgi:hypothetical protein